MEIIKIGKFNELPVSRLTERGVYLKAPNEEILMPRKYVPEGTKEGDIINSFIYTDSEDRLIATTLRPYACVGDFAYLRVKAVNNVGAFLDWGIEKDLFVPYREQEQNMEEGRSYVVYVFLDFETDRIAASTRLKTFVEWDDIELEEGQEVDLLIANRTDMGFNAIVNNRYMGLLYSNEIFQPLQTGDRVRGFVKKIREDKKIDLALQKSGGALVDEARGRILEAIEANNGFLPLNDNSSPEEIQRIVKLSKKAFKKAVGGLYKDRLIEITDSGIRLIGD
jgi:uncharacterized protein